MLRKWLCLCVWYLFLSIWSRKGTSYCFRSAFVYRNPFLMFCNFARDLWLWSQSLTSNGQKDMGKYGIFIDKTLVSCTFASFPVLCDSLESLPRWGSFRLRSMWMRLRHHSLPRHGSSIPSDFQPMHRYVEMSVMVKRAEQSGYRIIN